MVKRHSSKKSKQLHESTDIGTKIKTNGKRHLSGYQIFCAEQRKRPEFEKMKPTEIMKHLGAEWRKLSAQQQEAYKAKASTKTQHDTSHKEESKSQKNSKNHKSRSKSAAKKT